MNAGIYFLNKNFQLYTKKICSIEDDILPDLIKKEKINGLKIDNPFIDMGTKKIL